MVCMMRSATCDVRAGWALTCGWRRAADRDLLHAQDDAGGCSRLLEIFKNKDEFEAPPPPWQEHFSVREIECRTGTLGAALSGISPELRN
jgi:hypothetical protein